MDKFDIFDKKIAEIYKSGAKERLNLGGSATDFRRREFRAMAETFLGDEYSDTRLLEVEKLQTQLHEKQERLLERFQAGEIGPKEYVASFNTLLRSIFIDCEKILGKQDFLKLFGAPVDELGGYIDQEIFFAAHGINPEGVATP